ncbi:MAG: ATP-dependent zinc metalloprotease FtsH [Trueperaceae bacterium]|nr:ATP-dependent zinc metalloprotease FtsH [Trueperaceae bacterium]
MRRAPLQMLVVIALLVVVVLFVSSRGTGPTGGDVRSYTSFLRELEAGEIISVRVRGTELRIVPRQGEAYVVHVATPPTDLDTLARHGADVIAVPPGRDWGMITLFALPVVLMVLFLVYLMRGQRGSSDGGASAFGKSRAKRVSEETSTVTFLDVAGCEEAKDDLTEVVEFLRHPAKFHALGARIPHGVLMSGPPGSGKTHLAKAVAGEAKVPFFSISGSDFVEMFVGVGAARVRDLFETAKKTTPCIVFIDEIDAVGRKRGMSVHSGNDEREQTLNALLVEMDGFGSNHDVIIMAATNRPDVLDPALLRPGRFDRQVVVDAPDVRGREHILRIHARNKPMAASVDLATVARRTPGFVGADLENLLNEAALVAARRGRPEVHPHDLDEAADRVLMGPERRSRVIGERERRVTAYHEAGHALAAHLLEHADPVHKITIVPRGRALGYVMQFPDEDRMSATRTMLLDRIAVALAGRATEEIVVGDVTTGAQNDFQQATDVARRMVTRWGMSTSLGQVALSSGSEGYLGDMEGPRAYSEATATRVDAEVKALLDEAYARVRLLLGHHRDDLDRLVAILLERETLHAEEFSAIVRGEALPDPLPIGVEQRRPSPVEGRAAGGRGRGEPDPDAPHPGLGSPQPG